MVIRRVVSIQPHVQPFTLEGNFAFACIHELLLQSRNGYIEIFPAVPRSWNNVSFTNLRAEGAFIISAKKENGVPTTVKIFSEAGGKLNIKLPFKTWLIKEPPAQKFKIQDNGILSIHLKKGQTLHIENGYE